VNFVHLHLAINHSPLYAELFAFLILLIGMITRNRSVVNTALIIAIFAAGFAWAADFSGDKAKDIIDHSAPIAGVDKTMIHEHELAANFVVISASVAGFLAIVALFLRRGWMNFIVLLVILWSLTVVGRTALLGGRIHHPEVRDVIKG